MIIFLYSSFSNYASVLMNEKINLHVVLKYLIFMANLQAKLLAVLADFQD